MFKVQEFYCEDTPVDADIREAIHYANTHNCAVKITSWFLIPHPLYVKWLLSIFSRMKVLKWFVNDLST